ncbi:TetR/AcrR family transcriptional regulator [Xylanimonas allomyrinae]|nr:TetR family transcriptional regulator [Xylanimonas allomyrinae]
MHSVEPDDFSTRARIRDAAITRFAREGFRVPLRVIAADAGVSPALVIHHFGSKERLREECDRHVLEHSFMLKEGVLDDTDFELMRRLLSNMRAFDEPVAYLLRAILEGGSVARTILERTVASSEAYLEKAVAAGTVKPSHDPAARARYVTYLALGMLVMAFTAGSGEDDPYTHVTDAMSDLTLPHLELLTQGLLADGEYLRHYLDWKES